MDPRKFLVGAIVISLVLAPTVASAQSSGTGDVHATVDLDENTPNHAKATQSLSGTSCYTGQSAFEPSMGITSNGTIFMESAKVVQRGVLLINEIQRVVRSWGVCDEWKDVTLRLDAQVTEQTVPVQSNDPMVHVDRDTDRVFNLDMQGLSCNWLSFSDDFGNSWTTNPAACGQPPLLDHPSIFTGPARLTEDQTVLSAGDYPNIVYLCVNRIADSACARSLNGGLTFGPFHPLVFGGSCIGASLHHFGVTDSQGRAFIGQVNRCTGLPVVAKSLTDGITWSSTIVAQGVNADGHDVDVAIDEADNVYAAWIDGNDRRPRLAVSTTHGNSWSSPMDIAPDRLNTTSFISLEAGADGRVALSYYGTNATHAGGEVANGEPWGGLITVSTDVLSSSPTFETVNVNASGDPVARGPCNDDNRCEPPEFTGSPGDFLDIEIDDVGRPWAAMVDVCNGDCVTGTEKEDARAFAGTLEEGPKLRGPSGSLPTLS